MILAAMVSVCTAQLTRIECGVYVGYISHAESTHFYQVYTHFCTFLLVYIHKPSASQ